MLKLIKFNGNTYIPVDQVDHFRIQHLPSGRFCLVAVPIYPQVFSGPSAMSDGSEVVSHSYRDTIEEVEAILAVILEQINDDTTALIIVPPKEVTS